MAVKVSGVEVIDNSRNITNTASATITGDLTVDTDTLYVDSTNDMVGIGTASPSYKLDVVGELKATSYNEVYATTSSSSGSLTIDCETGNVFEVTLTENVTSTSFSNPPASGTAFGLTLRVVQDSTARTIAWPTAVKWPGGTAPTLTETSGGIDVFTFFTTDAGATWYGFISGQDFS